MDFNPALGHRINMVGRLYAKKLNKHILVTGITGSQWSVINRLLLHEELTQNQICEQLSLDTSTISKTLDTMEKMGWIKRCVDEFDRREKKVTLTDKAKDHFSEWAQISMNLQKKALSDITNEDADVFSRVLDKVFTNLKKEDY